MTFIDPERRHPRKPTWRYYLCDGCFQNFWSELLSDSATLRPGKHFCYDCNRPMRHPTGGELSPPNWSRADRQYHGSVDP